MHQRHDKRADLGSILGTGEKKFQWLKVMRIEGSNVAAANFDFQVSFQASLSLQKIQQRVLQKVRVEEKESKNIFMVIRAAEKESPLITHHAIKQ
jgi:hypothetical protein